MIQQSLGRVHTEWLTANLSRSYPLADSVGGEPGTLPCRLLADAFVLIYGDVLEPFSSLFINKVVSSDTEVVFYLAGLFEGSLVNFGPVATFDKQCEIGTVLDFEASSDNILISGKLVIGDLKTSKDLPTVLELTEATGKLFPGCYRVAPKGLQGLEVAGEVYTGVVELVAGAGVTLDVDKTDEATTITISVKDYEAPPENAVIVDDVTLLTQALELYGTPVRSINSCCPDTNGNIDIVADGDSLEDAPSDEEGSEGADTDNEEATDSDKKNVIYLSVKESDDSSGAIHVTLTKPQECEVTAVVESLLEMIQQLNQRATILDGAITEIDTAQANLAARLTGLA